MGLEWKPLSAFCPSRYCLLCGACRENLLEGVKFLSLMLLTTCPPQKCLSIPSARALARIWYLGRCESNFPPVQPGSAGSQLSTKLPLALGLIGDVENKALGFWGLFSLEWGQVWVLLLWTHQPESVYFKLPAEILHLQFYSWQPQACSQHLKVPGGTKRWALNIPCTLSTKSSCKNGALGLRLNSSWSPAVQAELFSSFFF